MPSVIRKFSLDETIDNANINAAAPRMQRLKELICGGGSWSNNNRICLIYWKPDANAPGGYKWVAWEDPDPLPPDVTIAP